MKKRELINLGFEGKAVLALALQVCKSAREFGLSKAGLRQDLKNLLVEPQKFVNVEPYSELAKLITHSPDLVQEYNLDQPIEYSSWGEEIDSQTHRQMERACMLPVSVGAALMPDAHLGYGLPIGGALATENAVIPYAVGVDIACRVMMTVLDVPLEYVKRKPEKIKKVLVQNTQFGIGAEWDRRRDHEVMSQNWNITPFVKSLKDKAWQQLGTSGSGNHFVDFGELEVFDDSLIEPGKYFALVSHSGSRAPGAKIALRYSKLARELHPNLPKGLKELAWLSMEKEGAEYWEAMQLMGQYASANHHVIHESIVSDLRASSVFQVENHHNFAWKESHAGKEVIVHRKGACPAAKGELGFIPGSMTAPGFLVEGLGNKAALDSCAHGAGRQMSRKQAKNSITNYQLKKHLQEHGVDLISAGLDEAPHAYKDIESVMQAQSDLVNVKARFDPKIVRMAEGKD